MVAAEPVRKYWFFGLDFKAPEPELVPVEGQPGLWRNTKTGDIFNFRDWTESDKYSTIVLPAEHGFTHNAGLSFVIPSLDHSFAARPGDAEKFRDDWLRATQGLGPVPVSTER